MLDITLDPFSKNLDLFDNREKKRSICYMSKYSKLIVLLQYYVWKIRYFMKIFMNEKKSEKNKEIFDDGRKTLFVFTLFQTYL